MSICKKCGREYKFIVCEFCAREAVWNNHPLEIHLRGHFTPRMLKELETYSSKSIKQKASMIVDNMMATEGSGVYIWHNQPRSGKTVMAMFIYVEMMKRAYMYNTSRNFIFTSMADLLDKESKYNYRDWALASPIEIASQVPLLVLDDFGVEKGIFNPANYEKIYKLITYRYEYLHPTIFTSNVSIDGLSQMMDDARIPSRIGRMCSQIIKYHYDTK
jgi:DNA replication protein DnaC